MGMTREEVISTLEVWIERDNAMEYADRAENIEIYKMAIKALEQEPILDKIRAEIEELKNAPPCFDDMFEYKYAVDDALAIIDKYKKESEDEE